MPEWLMNAVGNPTIGSFGEAAAVLGKLAVGLAGGGLIAGIAYRRGSLTKAGSVSAAILGALLVASGSIAWFGLVIVFFVSSSLLTKWRRREREEAESVYEKSGARDAGQVAANGGAALLFSLASAIWPSPLWWAAFLGAVASATADTWATEIGGAARQAPRSILTWRRVPAGTSGGVSGPGLAASVAGSLCIGAAAVLLALVLAGPGKPAATAGWPIVLLVAGVGGMCGSLADSLLGASVQRMYRCVTCGRTVEKPAHCGQAADRQRGWPFMNNDAVNVTASFIGALAAVLTAIVAGWR